MRKFTASLAIAAGLLIAPFTAFAAPEGEGWAQKFDEDRIQIYTRDDGRRYNAYHAETIIDAPLEVVIATLSKAGDMANYVEKFTETTVLEQPSETEYLIYMVMKTPPLNDRDMVQRGTLKYINDKEIVVEIVNQPDAHPEQKGRTRIRDMDQKWTAKELEDGRTFVQQIGYTDPDVGWMMSGMVDGMLPQEIYAVLSDVRDAVEAAAKNQETANAAQ
ncbi:MAG: hypothetical protein ACPG06_02850 [Alphaproteobacteria bacterium]